MKKFAYTSTEKINIEAEFYMDWAITSLERLPDGPYSNRGKKFYEVIRQLEKVMHEVKHLEKENLHQMQSAILH